MEDSQYVMCPYNPSHQMIRKRLDSHLYRCRRSYPHFVVIMCPFNPNHLISHWQLLTHTKECPDGKIHPKNVSSKHSAKVEGTEDIVSDTDWDDYDEILYGSNPKKQPKRKVLYKKRVDVCEKRTQRPHTPPAPSNLDWGIKSDRSPSANNF